MKYAAIPTVFFHWHRGLGACLVLFLLGQAAPALGQTLYATWINASGGSWDEVENWASWSGGTPPPTGMNSARFLATGNYTITFDGDRDPGAIHLVEHQSGDDDVDITFQLNGHTLDLGFNTTSAIAVNSGPGADRTLRLVNGTVNMNSRDLQVGTHLHTDENNGKARLVIGDGGTLASTKNATNHLTYNIGGHDGYCSSASVEILTGGRWEISGNGSASDNEVVFGKSDWGWGDPVTSFLIDGGVADFRAGGAGSETNLFIAQAGISNLTVRNGGELLGPRFLFVASNATHSTADGPVEGHILVESNGKIETAGGLRLGGWGTQPGGDEATLTIRSGGSVRFLADGISRFFGNSTLTIDGGTFYSEHNVEIWAGATYALTLHDNDATPFDATNGKVELRSDNGEGVTFELGNMAYGSYWADFQERDGETPGTMFDVLVYGAQDDHLEGEFVNYADGASVWTPDGKWEFVMHYAYSPSGGGLEDDDYRIALELVTIPEPHTMGLILLGLGAVALRRRLNRA